MEFRKGKYDGRQICIKMLNIDKPFMFLWTCCKLTLSQMMTCSAYSWSPFVQQNIPYTIQKSSVLHGPDETWRWRTPWLLMAAQRVTSPPCWPLIFIMASWPIMSHPLLLLLLLIKPGFIQEHAFWKPTHGIQSKHSPNKAKMSRFVSATAWQTSCVCIPVLL